MPPRRRIEVEPEEHANMEEGLNNQGGDQRRVDPQRLPTMRQFLEATRDFGPRLCHIEGDNYQIPPQLTTLVQQGAIFQGNNLEDPISHLTYFLSLCNTYRNVNISQDKLMIILFPISLRGAALDWFYTIDGPLHATFEEVKKKFVSKYLSPTKLERLRNEVYQFRQRDNEDLVEAWERFHEALRKCPNLLMERGYEYSIFLNGLKAETRNMVNSIIDMNFFDLQELLTKLVESSRLWPDEDRLGLRKSQQVLEVNLHTYYQAQIDVLTRQVQQLKAIANSSQVLCCEICQQDHHNDHCPLLSEQVNFENNYGRQGNQNNYQGGGWKGNSYNQQSGGTWNHGGLSTSSSNQYNRGPLGFSNTPQQKQGDGGSMSMEAMFQKIIEGQTHILSEVQRTSAKCDECVQKVQELDSRFKSLESQVSHLTQLMQQRQP